MSPGESSRRTRALGISLLVVGAVAGLVAAVALVPPLNRLVLGSRYDGPAPSPPTPMATTQWPDVTNTGIVGCPPLTRVDGPEVRIKNDGTVYENKEVHDAVIRVLANNVTIRCVKIIGSGYFGIDNTENDDPGPTRTDLVVDRVEIDCKDQGLGLLVRNATLSRMDVHHCSDMVMVGGNHVLVQDSYCHDLSQVPGVDIHADCIQAPGGSRDLEIRHNALWGWDTSDILLGQDGGDPADVVIEDNRLMADPDRSPAPAYLVYIGGTNTRVTNNRFSRRHTYGPCTRITDPTNITWTGNVWDDDGSPIPFADCG